ncbi:PREDICTED: coiled-coil domain-containing protein 63-like, partial [Ceratosolen solmsi marchali]|uniref:Coiled-coil domain-containing protein 63-like n=1 Tax=Ceratosolen solmsi marchali TaxID=326594 RepID=A0AAJ6YFM9_9HYME
LKRQYRIIENDRAVYVEDARNQLRNQNHIIDKLETEKAELVLAIKAAKSSGNVRKDEVLSAELKTILDKRSHFIEQIKIERQQIAEIQEQFIKLGKEVSGLKLKVFTEHQQKEKKEKNERLISVLENRLEVATTRFNILVNENSKLRQDIDDLLEERGQFNILWTRLSNQLNSGKRVINDLIEQATITFNQRDEEINKINGLKERGLRDLHHHTIEMCEMQRTIDNEMKLQEFLGVKGQYRKMNDLDDKKKAEKELKRQEMRNKIGVYNEILALVRQFTGEKVIDKLTQQFLKQEEENFALFSYVNELNDELEGLQTRVAQLRTSIDEARKLNVHRGEEQAETLKTIASELEKQTNEANATEKKLHEANAVMDSLLRGIDMLFHTTHCDKSPILELLGNNSTVNVENVMLYLGIIEKRINEMLNKVFWIDRMRRQELRIDESKKPKLQIPEISNIAPTQPCALCIEKEELENVSEGLEIPLTLNEVKNKLELRLQHDHSNLLHNVSGCHLPASRKIIQKRYQ